MYRQEKQKNFKQSRNYTPFPINVKEGKTAHSEKNSPKTVFSPVFSRGKTFFQKIPVFQKIF